MNKHLLLAEDHPDTAELIKFGLEKLGYEVKVAKNGLEAVEKASSECPDLKRNGLALEHACRCRRGTWRRNRRW